MKLSVKSQNKTLSVAQIKAKIKQYNPVTEKQEKLNIEKGKIFKIAHLIVKQSNNINFSESLKTVYEFIKLVKAAKPDNLQAYLNSLTKPTKKTVRELIETFEKPLINCIMPNANKDIKIDNRDILTILYQEKIFFNWTISKLKLSMPDKPKLGYSELTQDILQETAIRLIHNQLLYDSSKGTKRSFIFANLKQVMINTIKSNGIQKSLQTASINTTFNNEDDSISIYEKNMAVTDSNITNCDYSIDEMLNKALGNKFNPTHREIYKDYINGAKQQDTANKFETTVQAVKMVVYKINQQLDANKNKLANLLLN